MNLAVNSYKSTWNRYTKQAGGYRTEGPFNRGVSKTLNTTTQIDAEYLVKTPCLASQRGRALPPSFPHKDFAFVKRHSLLDNITQILAGWLGRDLLPGGD
jgi:hypothetical protein